MADNLEAMLDETAAPAAIDQQSTPAPDTGVKEQAPAPPTDAQSTPPQGYAPLAALSDERRKRQELEKKVEQFERILQQQPKQAVPQQPAPDWYAEPEKAAQHMSQQIAAQVYETRVHLSQEFMRSQKTDYDAMEQIFAEDAEKNPQLWAEINRHPMPAKFAYEYGKRQAMLREIGDDPEAYKKRIIDEWQSSQGQQPQQPASNPAPSPSRAPVPTSLANTRSVAPRDDRGRFTGPTSLEQIFGE